jgi:hypothetical protein
MSLHKAPAALRSDRRHTAKREGKAGWIMLWLLGVPLPILGILFLIRGCT